MPNNKKPVDACTIVKDELGLLDVPTKNERRYPTGVPVSYHIIISRSYHSCVS